jgi:ABC-type thiamin/hydroxymethylpyrimidine transport system permease subunit
MKEKEPFQFKLETDPIMHVTSIIASVIISYYFVPGNLASPGTMLSLLIANFISVNLVSNLLRWMKGE